MGILNKLFGGENKAEKITDALTRGAIIVDVRSPGEFNQGAVPGAVNYPVQTLTKHVAKLKKSGKPVIAYCASGMRSAAATSQLKASGIEAYNAGTAGGVMKFM